MGNRVVRIVLGIVLAVGAVIGIYFILPGSIKYPLQEKLQSWLKSDQYETVTYLKSLFVPGSDDVTFGTMIEYAGKHGSWIIENSEVGDDKKSGDYEIGAYVYDVDISMAQENGQENRKSMSQASVSIKFIVKRTVGADPEYVVTSYYLSIDDEGQNNFYRAEALKSMAGTAKRKAQDAAILEAQTQ